MSQNNFIKTCHWEITKRCNLSCIHCISSVGNRRELNTAKALKAVDVLDSLECKELYITGGEPLVRKDIFKILKKAKEYNFKISLLTNGTLMNNKNIKEVKSYVDNIGISLDGSCPQVNAQIRGSGSFKKVIKAILLIKKNQIPLTLYITLTGINFNDFENILKLAIKLKVENIRINEVSFRGKAFKNRKFLKLSKEQASLREYILKTLTKYFDQGQTKIRFSNNCDVDPKIIFLSPTGYIYPCIDIFQTNQSAHLGNILDYNLQRFKKYMEHFSRARAKKVRCPYQLIVGKKFAACLNIPNNKCDYIKP